MDEMSPAGKTAEEREIAVQEIIAAFSVRNVDRQQAEETLRALPDDRLSGMLDEMRANLARREARGPSNAGDEERFEEAREEACAKLAEGLTRLAAVQRRINAAKE